LSLRPLDLRGDNEYANEKANALNSNHGRKKAREIICLCNNVPRDVIEAAICNGCDTLNKIFDATTAGVGPCGGSCRRKLQPMLDTYQETGKFPEIIREDKRGKRR
jgi:bacterioferritin-associated ferredoxin